MPGPAPYVVAIHVAPGSRLPVKSVRSVVAEAGKGIVGDRYHGTRHRHVSVQSATSLAEAAETFGAPIDAGGTRRNITMSRLLFLAGAGHRHAPLAHGQRGADAARCPTPPGPSETSPGCR